VPRKTIKTFTILAAAASMAGSLAYTPVAEAFGFGDMMNPSKWMGGRNRDRYDDDYYDGPYGGGPGWGGPGYGYGGPGYGLGGPGYGGYGVPGYGYGAPGYGYGAPAVAAPAVPAAVAPATPAAAPAQSSSRSSSASEIEALKRRIDELEASQRPSTQAPASTDWPSAPAFRPMSKY
jgi:hypothetical protein